MSDLVRCHLQLQQYRKLLPGDARASEIYGRRDSRSLRWGWGLGLGSKFRGRHPDLRVWGWGFLEFLGVEGQMGGFKGCPG